MKIVCIGGGPAGLYFGLLMKKLDPAHEVIVVERNKPYDTFGWGVVFSDATMDNMRAWDIETANEIQLAFNHWDDIELLFKGRTIRSGGHGFVGIGRKKLLNILQARCEQLGVQLQFETDVESDLDFPDADLVIASDGINSRIRTKYADTFRPDIVVRPNRYIWLGTHRLYDAFTFDFQKTEHGWFQAHIYKFDDSTTTFIVECPEHVWLAHRLDKADQEQSIAFCENLFRDTLQGHKLMTNARHLRGSAWLNFQRVRCDQWWLRNEHGSHVVLMGDAVHTAHFAIGSGTKLAIEDAMELARQFQIAGDTPEHIPEVLERYQAVRAVDVLRLQNAAWNAMEWFEVCGQRYCDQLEPEQFMYSMLTRSQRISHENLRLRDKGWLEGYERWFAARAAAQTGTAEVKGVVPPMFTPWKVRSVTLKNRVMVSPMAQYSCTDGLPGDYHLAHLGARALGGAALVMAEMTCPSPDARITPGCPGLWSDEQTAGWKRITDFVHGQTDARIGIQIGHAGPKGSTCAPWQGGGMDQALPEGNWPLLAASAQPYLPDGQVPRAMTREDMDRVREDFVAATRRAAAAGFDWLELHCAHG
ncbi:MAG: bifunctional salicylyl-CoA 5-hydroxylase/oxidoreductase, partial [Burkholderiales bacterium]